MQYKTFITSINYINFKMGTGSFPGVKCGRGVLLTTHPLLVPRSWKSRAIPLPTLWATHGLQQDNFTFTLYIYTRAHTHTHTYFCVCVWAGYLSRFSDWLRAGQFGIKSRLGRDFPPVQTGPGAHPASCKTGTGSFPGVKCGRGVLLTTHPLLVPRSWKSRAIPLPTVWATPGL